jgi:hypothetical protein
MAACASSTTWPRFGRCARSRTVCSAVNATSFFISAALIWGMKLPARSRAPRTSTLAELRHGWAEFVSRQWLWVVVAQFAIVLAAVNATVGVLGPLEMTSSGSGAATRQGVVRFRRGKVRLRCRKWP